MTFDFFSEIAQEVFKISMGGGGGGAVKRLKTDKWDICNVQWLWKYTVYVCST